MALQFADTEQTEGFNPEEYPGEQSTGSKQNGNDAESWVRDHYNLDGQDPDICPTSAHDAVDPRTGTPIEIKSCQIRYSGSGSRGRFQLWDYAHDILMEHGGGYIFVVHEPGIDEFHVYLHRPLSADAVDALIGNWHAIDHNLRPDDAQRTSLGQSLVFSDIQVSRLEPEEPEEEQPETDAGERPAFDADAIEERPSHVEHMKTTLEAVRTVEAQHENQLAPHGAVVQEAVDDSDLSPERVETHLQELKKVGDIYQPEKDAYRVT